MEIPERVIGALKQNRYAYIVVYTCYVILAQNALVCKHFDSCVCRQKFCVHVRTCV